MTPSRILTAIAAVAMVLGLAAPANARAGFGVTVPSASGTMTAIERAAGRNMDQTRVFFQWDSQFPSPYVKYLLRTHTKPIISVQAINGDGHRVSWRTIANAKPGSWTYRTIVRWAQGMKHLHERLWFAFSHEPTVASNVGSGTARDYTAAYRKVWHVFHAQGVTNVRHMWISTAQSFREPRKSRTNAARWYPGDKYVAAVGTDPYNWFRCTNPKGSWRSLRDVASSSLRFAHQHHKALHLTEFASTEDGAHPGRKAAWLRSAYTWIRSHPRIHSATYYAVAPPRDRSACKWSPQSSWRSMQVFKAVGQWRYFTRRR